MRKLKNKKILLLVVSLIINFIGCSRRSDSLEVLNEYYNNIKSKNFDINYEYLTSASKNIWTKEEYQEWEDINNQVISFKSVKSNKTNEFNNKELDGIKYEDVVEYSITETDHDNTSNKDIDSDYIRYVVKENGDWKIYRGKEDPKEKIALSASELAGMYATGSGENKDLTKAISTLEYSIEVNSDYSPNYYLLGLTYIQLGKYDEAIKNEQQCIEKAKNGEEKSNGYNGLAETYEWKKDYSSAKEYYGKALEANPDNQNAKERLADLNSK